MNTNYLLNRLTEQSTWRGLILLLTALGVQMEPEKAEAIIATGLAAVGLINVFRKERHSPDAKPGPTELLPAVRRLATPPPAEESTGKPTAMTHTTLMALALSGLLVLTGCQTASPPPAPSQADTATALLIVTETGVLTDLMAHPEHRPYYQAALVVLNDLKAQRNQDPAALIAALRQMPVSTLRSDEGALYLTGGVLLYQVVTRQLTQVDAGAAVPEAYSDALRTGLATALAIDAARQR